MRGAAARGGVTEAPPPGGSPPRPIPKQEWGGLRACSAPPAPRRESQRSERPEPPEHFLSKPSRDS